MRLGTESRIRAAGAEKTFQQVTGFRFLDAGLDFEDVVQPGGRGDGKDRARAAGALVTDTEHETLQAREHHGAGAHGAGFFGDKERAAFESPVAEGVGRLRDHKDFGVGGGVFEQLHLIVGAGDDFRVADDDRADGHFVSLVGHAREPQRLAHEIVITGQVDARGRSFGLAGLNHKRKLASLTGSGKRFGVRRPWQGSDQVWRGAGVGLEVSRSFLRFADHGLHERLHESRESFPSHDQPTERLPLVQDELVYFGNQGVRARRDGDLVFDDARLPHSHRPDFPRRGVAQRGLKICC